MDTPGHNGHFRTKVDFLGKSGSGRLPDAILSPIEKANQVFRLVKAQKSNSRSLTLLTFEGRPVMFDDRDIPSVTTVRETASPGS